jgi:hypothetical protein
MNSDVSIEYTKTKQERSSDYLWEKRREWDQIVQQLNSLQLQYQRQPKQQLKSKRNDSFFELSTILSQLNGLAQSLFNSANNPIGKDVFTTVFQFSQLGIWYLFTSRCRFGQVLQLRRRSFFKVVPIHGNSFPQYACWPLFSIF